MGRQVAIAMAPEDEARFLSFLRSVAPVRFIESLAPEPEQLWAEEPKPAGPGQFFYSVWNTGFPWQPEYGQVGPQARDATHIGWHYIANTSEGPVLQWSRCDLSRQMFGRLYWAKLPAAYDIEAFDRWVSSIWRWIRKNGRKLRAGDSMSPYCLPSAFAYLTKES